VGLVSLASLCRPDDEVRVLDEKASPFPEPLEADLVGISFKTMYADHAYALADRLRAGGVRVALGGLHASLCPAEAGAHADIVVAGEGEAVWPQVLADLDRGAARPLYRAPAPPAPIDGLPRQRVELMAHERYLLHSVQTARGCSLDCEFCPTRAMFGAGFRLRRVDAVAAEVRELLRLQRKHVLFTDDVFGAGNPGFIAELTSALKPLGVSYTVICDLKMLTPPIVGQLAASGCRFMTINMPGTCLPEELAAVRQIQAAGIRVWGYFMFGFEFHKPDVFERVVHFVREGDIQQVSLTLLAPYPGTPMGERLRKEGRILSSDYRRYDQSHVVFRPAGMTPEQLEEGFGLVVREIGDRASIQRVMDHLDKRG
jgi:radical SAM superfamily enzyme YgiQ (UPF0313 family)